MTKLDPLDAYKMYLSVKNHFTKDGYDYFKYRGKSFASKESFLARKDKHIFYKIAHSYSEEEYLEVLVSNFLHDSSIWAGDIASKEGHRQYELHKKIIGSLEYTFKEDINRLLEEVEEPNDIFKIEDGQNPLILNAYYAKEISIETFIILNDIVPFFVSLDKELVDDIIWPKEKIRCMKYSPFIQYNKENFVKITKKILDEKMNENNQKVHQL